MPDITAQANQNLSPNPVNQPTAAPAPDMNPPNQPSKPSFFKVPLLTAISLIFLISIISITIALYIENNKTSSQLNEDVQKQQAIEINDPLPASQQFVLDESVTCANFDNLDNALRYPDKTCGLNLSGQNLTIVPEEIYTSFPNLNEINLSNNNLTEFPVRIIDEVENLVSLDLSNNDISSIPDSIPDNETEINSTTDESGEVVLTRIKFPQILILEGNPLSENLISSYERVNE